MLPISVAFLCSALMICATALVHKTPSFTDKILNLVSASQSDHTGIAQRSFTDNFHNANYQIPVNNGVQDVIARANKLAEQRTEQSGSCKRDFSSCPAGWSLISGDTCVSSSYQGPCSNQLSVALTIGKKKQLQEECSVGYPCVDDRCAYDYTMCPDGFLQSEDGFCNRVTQSQSSCDLQTLKLDQLTIPQKQSLIRTCGLEFPCSKQVCQPSYQNACPDEWSLDGQVCVAPSNYNSASTGCSLQISTANWTMSEKQQFSVRCKVSFGCGSSTFFQNYYNLEPALGVEHIRNGAVSSDGIVASLVSPSQTLSPGSFAGPLDFAAMQR